MLVAFAIGSFGNAVKAVPQFVRTALHGRVAGLSPAAVWLVFTANVLWLCFGIAIGDWLFVGLGVMQTVLTGATLMRYVTLTGWRRSRRHAATDVSGVSQPEYLIVVAAQVAWTTYWLLRGHPIAAAGAARGGLARALTLVLLRKQASRVPRQPAAWP